MVRYALTGTPGTGKTTISKLLDQKIIALSDYYKDSSEGKTGSGEWIIDIDKIKKNVFITEDSILEGHFAHEFDNIDQIIVLRCDPKVLVERLEKRGYSKEKIRENLEAEAIGTIYSESLERLDFTNIAQLDTSSNTVSESADILKEFMNGNIKLEEEIDYSERILEWY